MKTKLFAAMIAALVSLTACGGGGGGGGGGGLDVQAPAPITWTPDPAPFGAGSGTPVANATDAFGVGTAAISNGAMIQSLPGYASVSKTADGIRISVLSGGDVDREVAFSLAGGDFFKTADGFITAVKTSSGRYEGNSAISYKAQDTLILGGKKDHLEYSDFGLWATYERARYDDQGPDGGSTTTGAMPFAMGNADRATGFSGSGAQTFTGTTIASASGGGGPSGVDYLTGTVSMNFNASSSINTNLTINLTDFATFTVPVAVNGSGGISRGSGSIGVSGVQTSRDLSGMTGRVDGQFYGPSAGSPSEGSGSYHLESGGQMWTTINGAFGLKKQP